MPTGTKIKNPHLLISLFDLMVLPSPNRISDISGPASLGTRDGNMSVLLPSRILTLHKIRQVSRDLFIHQCHSDTAKIVLLALDSLLSGLGTGAP